ALADAADDDRDFANALTQAVEAVRQVEQATETGVVSASRRGVAVGRDINVTASDGGVAGVTLGDVSVGYPPGRPGAGEGGRAAAGAEGLRHRREARNSAGPDWAGGKSVGCGQGARCRGWPRRLADRCEMDAVRNRGRAAVAIVPGGVRADPRVHRGDRPGR